MGIDRDSHEKLFSSWSFWHGSIPLLHKLIHGKLKAVAHIPKSLFLDFLLHPAERFVIN
jgi:hypothetical protein